MASEDKNTMLFHVQITGDDKQFRQVLKKVSDQLSDTLSDSLAKSTSSFAKKLGNSIQINFNDTILQELKSPIKLNIDIADATRKINNLLKGIKSVANDLPKIQAAGSKSKKLKDAADTASAKTNLQNERLSNVTKNASELSKLIKGDAQISEKLPQLKAQLEKIITSIKEVQREGGIFSSKDISKINSAEKGLEKINNALEEQAKFREKVNAVRELSKSKENPNSDLVSRLNISKDILSGVKTEDGRRLFNDQSIKAISASVDKDLEYLREKYNVLFDEVLKGDEANDKIIAQTMGQIENRRALAESRLKTLEKNRDDILNRGLKRTEEDIVKEQEKAAIEADKNYSRFLSGRNKDIIAYTEQLRKQRVIAGVRALKDASPTGEIEKDINAFNSILKTFKLNDKQIEGYTKGIVSNFTDLKVKYQQLFNEVSKNDKDIDFKRVEQLKKKVEEVSDLIKAKLDVGLDTDKINKFLNTGESLKTDPVEKARRDRLNSFTTLEQKNKQIVAESVKARQEINSLTSGKSATLDVKYLDRVTKELTDARLAVSKLGVPLNVVNKQTLNYETTLIKLRKELQDLNNEFRSGNIVATDAVKKYKQLNTGLRQLEIGINQIDGDRIKKAFDLEEVDPRRLSFRLGILAFTFSQLGNAISSFSRNLFQGFDTLVQAGEPIEKVTNQLALQVKNGEISARQQETILKRLRELGDLPGSTVEKANETYNSLQRINLSLQQRLDLTEGLIKLTTAPGGSEDSANRFAEALAKISNKREVEGDNFKTLRETGGKFFEKFIRDRGIGTTDDVNKFGYAKLITELAVELKKLDPPVSTTADKINKLRSRLAEFGIVLGKVVGPGLTLLNQVLRDSILPTLTALGERFDSLSGSTKTFISSIVVGIPVILTLVGGLLAALAAVGVAASGFRQIKEIGPLLGFTGSKGAVAATTATQGAINTGKIIATPSSIAAGGASTVAATAATVNASKGAAQVSASLSKLLLPLKATKDTLSGLFGVINSSFRPGSTGIVKVIESLVKVLLKLGATLTAGPIISGFNILKLLNGLTFAKLLTGLKGIGSGLGSVGGGLLKVLGFTNPIGIAINAILSVFTALISNFNGIRTRITASFRSLDDAIRRLLKTLGIEGGLLYVLGLIGDAFNFIFGVIGESVLNVLVSLVNSLRDIINNVTNIIQLIKKGDYISALGEGVKLIFNSLFGFARNLVIELVATLGDAIARLVESIPGIGRRLSEFFREGSDDIRSFNGTDKKSLEKDKTEQDRLDAIQDRIDKEKELADFLKKQDEERQSRLADNIEELNALIKKTKEDYIKFQSEQLINAFKGVQDRAKTENEAIITQFKEFIESTGNINQINAQYSRTLQDLAKNQKLILSSQSNIGFQQAIAEFRQIVSPNGELKPIYEAFSNGEQQFRSVIDSISAAANSDNLRSFTNALNSLQNAANNIKGDKINGQFSVIFSNVIEKSKSLISKNSNEIRKFVDEYRKAVVDLIKLEAQRKINIERERSNIEADRKNRQIDRGLRLKELSDNARDLSKERKIATLETFETLDKNQREVITRRAELLKTRQIILKDLNDIRLSEIEKEQNDLINSLNVNGKTVEEIQAEVTALRNRLLNSDSVSFDAKISERNAQFVNLKTQLQELESDFKLIEEKYKVISAELSKNITFKFANSIVDLFRDINSLSTAGFDKLNESIGKFYSLFNKANQKANTGDLGGYKSNVQLAINTLSDSLLNLIDVTSKLPNSSSTTNELKSIFNELTSGAITSTQALDKLINQIVKFRTQSEIADRTDKVNQYNSIVTQLNDKGGKFNKIQDNFNLGAEQFNLKNVFGSLTGQIVGKDSLIKNIGELLNDELISDVLKEQLKVIKDKIDLSGVNNEVATEFFAIIQQVAATNRNAAVKILTASFNNGDNNISSLLIELFTKAVEVEASRLKELQATAEATINTKIQTLSSQSESDLARLDLNIQESQNKLLSIESELTNSSGRRRTQLLKDQGQAKLDIINFNYEKLDLEAAYNTQRLVILANGNKSEIDLIISQGKATREQLRRDREQQIEDLLKEGYSVDVKNLGKSPVKVNNIGTTDKSGDIVNKGTTPEVGEDAPSRAELIINKTKELSNELDGVKNSALEAANAMQEFFNKTASGQGILNIFSKLIAGQSFKLKDLGEAFMDVAAFAITAFGQALGQAITDTLLNGGNFLKNLKKFFGDILITLGSQLISLGAMATAIGLLALIPFFSYLDPDHKALIFGPIAIAAGVAAVAAGKALGGGSSGAAVSNEGTSNSANSSTGASGEVNYDPEKDPKLIYQRALRSEVYINITRDDASMVKTLIKQVNRNQQLANIIGNERIGFAL